MKVKTKNKKTNYIVRETMVYLEDYVSCKNTYFKSLQETIEFYEKRKEEIQEEIYSTDGFRGYERDGFNVVELENELDLDKVVLIHDKPQTELIFLMGYKEEAC